MNNILHTKQQHTYTAMNKTNKIGLGAMLCAVVVGVLVAYMVKQRYDVENHEYGFKCVNSLPTNIPVCVEKHPAIYEAMTKIDRALVTKNVAYLLVAESALGAERHAALIPWDDKVTIGVFDIDTVVKSIAEEWPEAKIEETQYGGIRVQDCVNVIALKKVHNKVCYENYRARLEWSQHYFAMDEIDTVRAAFGSTEVNISSHNRDYVQRIFGSDCLSRCSVRIPRNITGLPRFIMAVNPLVKRNFQITLK